VAFRGWKERLPEENSTMSPTPTHPVLHHVRQLAADLSGDPVSDCDLLRRFSVARDQDAFADLVRRHGAMVLGVCQRVLQSHQDAEDTVQATFLVLARKAGSRAWHASVGPWLHQVAFCLACKARAAAARRSAHLARLRDRAANAPREEPSWRELHSVLDQELQRLPAKYSDPLILCHLEGATRDEAAQQLGCPLGTLKSRLERGRELLRCRLARRGVTLSAALSVVGLTQQTSNGAPAGLAAAVCAKAAGLAHCTVRGLAFKVAGLLLIGLVAAGAGLLAHQALAPTTPELPAAVAALPADPAAEAGRDHQGDPLPDEALARLGTLRFRHGGHIRSLGFSANGRQVVANGSDGVRVWEAATGKQIRRFAYEADAGWTGSISGDAARVTLAASNSAGNVSIWDVTAGKLLRQFGRRQLSAVLFSPDGKVLAAPGYTEPGPREHVIDLWDPLTGVLLRTLQGHTDRIWDVAFSADGKTLVSGSDDQTIRCWNVATGEPGRKIAAGGGVSRVRLSPDGKTVAAFFHNQRHEAGVTSWISNGTAIYLWDVRTGRRLAELTMAAVEFTTNMRLGFSDLAFAPDGKALVTGGFDGVIRVWDIATASEIRKYSGFAPGPRALAIAPGGKTLAFAEGGAVVRLIDYATGKDLFPTGGHRAGVALTAFTAGGHMVVTAGWDRTFCFWDPRTGAEVRRRTLTGAGLGVPQLLPGGRIYLMADADKALGVFDLDTGAEIRGLRGHKARSNFVLAPNGKTLAEVTFEDKAIQLIDPVTGKVLCTLGGSGQNLVFTPDSRRLFACNGDMTVSRWDVATGKKLASFLVPTDRPRPGAGDPAPSYTAQFSRDGALVVFGLQEDFVPIVDATSGKEVRRFHTAPDGACFFAFSADGKTLAWAGWRDPTVYLGEMATSKERHRFHGHAGRVTSLAFSPDGKTLLSGSEDTTALVWDLAACAADRRKSPQALSQREMDTLWAQLSGENAIAAYRAVRALAADPQRAVAYLSSRLRPVALPDEQAIARHIANLESDTFRDRETAGQELEKMGQAALPALRNALLGTPGPEARRRLEELVSHQERELESLSPDRLRLLRSIEVLELVATKEAREVLAAVAAGAPGAWLTEDARAAHKRLAQP
jgi:RNA polymerase sigma factor (sigma-70 family)